MLSLRWVPTFRWGCGNTIKSCRSSILARPRCDLSDGCAAESKYTAPYWGIATKPVLENAVDQYNTGVLCFDRRYRCRWLECIRVSVSGACQHGVGVGCRAEASLVAACCNRMENDAPEYCFC